MMEITIIGGNLILDCVTKAYMCIDLFVLYDQDNSFQNSEFGVTSIVYLII